MLKAARLLIVPVLLLAAMRPSFAQTITAELLAQPPEKAGGAEERSPYRQGDEISRKSRIPAPMS